ncbi:MAG: S-layer homology domain-containing protein [Clostridiales bacterium]|nr:S-layer homology domain-containing protein [Clostridiales bacterium]
MKKHFLLTLLAALLCAAMVLPAAAADVTFKDVPEGAWYYSDVMAAVKEGLVNGRTADTYCPDENMTAAEAVKLAACMNEIRTTGQITLTNGDPWYAPYVEYAKAAGIISADYAWNEPITRADYMTIFAHALPDGNYVEVNAIPDGGLPDVAGDAPHAAEIYKLARAGIVQGDENHNVNPGDAIRRCEVAAILTRMMHPEKRVSFWKGATDTGAGAQSFVGLWNDLTSQRANMTIMSSAEYPYYDVTIHWADSAGSAAEWTMKASYDANAGRLVYENGKMAYVTYDEGGKGTADEKWADGTGSFFWSADGILMWEDSREERSTAFRFDCAPTAAPTAEELTTGFFKVIGGIQTGTAGASLKQASAIAEAMGFASRNTIWAANNTTLRKNILAAWNALTPEEQTAFDDNFIAVLTAARNAKENWEENKGAYEDAGVAETMTGFLSDRGAWLSWEALTSNTLTMGNSDGSDTLTGDTFVGEWAADRASLTITPSEDGYLCKVHWASSATECSEWEYFCWFDGETLASVETGTRKDLIYGSDGQVLSSKIVFSDGAAAFQFNDEGKLTWIDFKVYPDNDNNLQFVRVVGDSLANP